MFFFIVTLRLIMTNGSAVFTFFLKIRQTLFMEKSGPDFSDTSDTKNNNALNIEVN